DGADVLIGDHGLITQQPGIRRIFSTGEVERAETVQSTVGAADLLYGNAGNDVILGGLGGDYIYGGNSTGPLPSTFASSLIAVGASNATVVANKFGVLQNVAVTGAD